MNNNYAHPEVLVGTQWVLEHYQDHNVAIVEVDVDTNAYKEGHAECDCMGMELATLRYGAPGHSFSEGIRSSDVHLWGQAGDHRGPIRR